MSPTLSIIENIILPNPEVSFREKIPLGGSTSRGCDKALASVGLARFPRFPRVCAKLSGDQMSIARTANKTEPGVDLPARDLVK